MFRYISAPRDQMHELSGGMPTGCVDLLRARNTTKRLKKSQPVPACREKTERSGSSPIWYCVPWMKIKDKRLIPRRELLTPYLAQQPHIAKARGFLGYRA